MGWCSATFIFDEMAEFVLSTDKLDFDKVTILKKLASVLEDNDWDCQWDSLFIGHPVVHQVFEQLHEGFYE